MRPAFLLAAASAAFGLVLLAQPAAAYPYGPQNERVNPSHRCGCGDDWGSGGSPGYYADGRYYSSYPGRRDHRRHHYRGGYGDGRYGPAYGQGGQGYGPQQAYGPPQGYGPEQGYGPQQGYDPSGPQPTYGPQDQPPYPGPQGG